MKNNLDGSASQVRYFVFQLFLVFKTFFVFYQEQFEWQHISGPICEPPPPLPFEGEVTLNVTERELDKVKTCKVTVAQFAQMIV